MKKGLIHGRLTLFGKDLVRRAVAMGFIIDVAYSSAASVDDVLAINPNPVVVSHTGIEGTIRLVMGENQLGFLVAQLP